MKTLLTIVAAALLLTAFAAAGRAGDTPDPVARMAAGKATFEKSCGFCHSLDRSLSRTKDRAGWMQTVKRMVTYGAPLDSGQREGVTAYLTAQSNFRAGCNSCHSNLKVLAEPAGNKDWKVTMERMSGHLKELAAKDKDAKVLSDGEIEEIGALLSVVIPKD